jgi:hypothetical protein
MKELHGMEYQQTNQKKTWKLKLTAALAACAVTVAAFSGNVSTILAQQEEEDQSGKTEYSIGSKNWILQNPEKYLALAVGDEGDFELSFEPVLGVEFTGTFSTTGTGNPYLPVAEKDSLHWKAIKSGTIVVWVEGEWDEESNQRLLDTYPDIVFTQDGNCAGFQVIIGDPVYRLYNPNSGEHFYTIDATERDNLVGLGWRAEDTAWISAPQYKDDMDPDENNPVYRLYNPNAGDHHYTLSSKERDFLVSEGWKYEGISWYSLADTNSELERPVAYRLYNPNAVSGAHFYTLNSEEAEYLKSLGWKDEGTCWNSLR